MGNIGSKLISFLLLPYYTHKLTLAEYGRLDLITTSILFFELIVTLKLDHSLYKFFNGKTANKSQIKFQVASSIIMMSILVAGLYFLTENFIELKPGRITLIYILTSIYRNSLRMFLRAERRRKLYSISGVVHTFLFLTLNIVMISKFNLGLEGVLFSGIISNLSVFLFFKVLRFNEIRKEDITFKDMKNLISFSFPLAITSFLWWIIRFSDKFVLTYFRGIEVNSIYGAAVKISSILIIFESIFNLIWQETAVDMKVENRKEIYGKVYTEYNKVQLTMCLLLISSYRIFCTYFLETRYSQVWKYAVILLIANYFKGRISFLAVILYEQSQNEKLIKPLVIGSAANILLNLYLVRIFGISAVVFSTLICYLLIYMMIKNEVDVDIDFNKLFSYKILILISLIGNFTLNDYGVIINLLIMIIISLKFNKKIIKKVIGVVR